MKRLIISLVIGLLVCNVYGTIGDSWGLSDDWDTVNNPSAPWSYHAAPGTLQTTYGAWGGGDFPLGETGWSMAPGNHLGMSKLVHDGSEDTAHTYTYAVGEVCGHTNTTWGAAWDSSETGFYTISGSAHKIRAGMGTVFVSVIADGVTLFDQRLDEVVGTPYAFSHTVALDAGAVVDLVVHSNGENGDFGCVGAYTIEQVIPEPATLLLLAGGAISMICRKKRV